MDRIVFIGFMGAGKSAAGRSLARKCAWKFFDMDTLAQVLSGYDSINEIFDKYGEQYFRKIELRVAETLKDEKQAVISTGGGVVMNPELMKLIKTPETCIVYIRVSFPELERRLSGNETRPLFRDIDRAKELYEQRLEYYEKYADLIVNTDGHTPLESSEKIVHDLKTGGWL